MSGPRPFGIWPPIVIETNSRGDIDLDVAETLMRRLVAGGVHGVYTADTASEFYTLEYDEWDRLATAIRAIADELDVPAGIGCTWTNQAGILRRIDRAHKLGYHNIHLSQPYWLRLNAAAQQTFWEAVAGVVGDLDVIVYGGSQGQLPLDGTMVRRLVEWCPAIVGTKTVGFDAVATNSLFAMAGDLAHFVHEEVLVQWSGLGAVGSFSNLALLSPSFVVRWFADIQAGRWDAAFRTQRAVAAFYAQGAVPIRAAGYQIDKAMAELGGHPGVTRTLRAPYAAVPDELFNGLRRAAERHIPYALREETDS